MMMRQTMWTMLTVVGLLAAGAETVRSEIVGEGDLVGWWRLGEDAWFNGTVWTVPDASGNGHTGTSRSMRADDRVDGYPFDTGPEPSYAMQFESMRNETINTAYDPSLRIDSSFTISAWVRTTQDTSYDRIVAGRFDGLSLEHNYILQLTDNRVSLCYRQIESGGWPWPKIGGSTVLAPYQWYHVAGVFDDQSDLMTVFVNGLADGSMVSSGTPDSSSSFGVSIGANDPEGNRYFDGSIDDVRIYNAALSYTDIAAIYNAGAGDYQVVPEPSTLTLALVTLLGGVWCVRRRAAS